MAIFETLEAENALSYRNLRVSFDAQGLVLIDGQVGAGKSSIFDILTHVLYGETPKDGIRENGILNRYVTDKDGPYGYKAEVTFRHRGHQYVVTQKRRFEGETGVTYTEDGFVQDIKRNRSKNRDTQKDLAAKIGMSSREFYGGVYLSQGYTHDLIVGTPSKRSEYLIRYFGIDLIDQLIQEFSKETTQLATAADVTSYDAKIAALEAELAQYGTLDVIGTDLVNQRAEAERTSADLDQHKSILARMETQLVQRNAYVAAGREIEQHPHYPMGSDAVEDELEGLRVEVAELTSQENTFLRHQEILGQLQTETLLPDVSASQAELDLLRQKIASYLADAPKHKEIAKLRGLLLPTAPTWTETDGQKLKAASERLAATNANLANITSELKAIEALGAVCLTCQRPVSDEEKASWVYERKFAIQTLSKSIAKLRDEVSTLDGTLKLYNAHAAIMRDIGVLELQLSGPFEAIDVDEYQRRVVDLTRAIASHLRYLKLKANVAADLDDDTIATGLDAVRDKKRKVTERMASLAQYLRLLEARGPDPGEILESDVVKKRAVVALYIEELQSFQEKIGGLKHQQDVVQRLQRSLAEVVKSRASIAEIVRSHRIHHVTHLSLKDIRKLRLHDAAEMLAQRLPIYLQTLFHGEDIRVEVAEEEDSFDLMLFKSGTNIPLKGLSGGQKNKLGLAVLFAFTRMVNRQSNMLALDEPYTNLDARSRSACYDILRDIIATDRSLTSIFVMSHEQDLKNQRFDQRWLVRYDGRFSELQT